MNIIVLFALIFVVLNLANKYLKVPKDNNQRYDGINNRFYGEGYTGETPVTPSKNDNPENEPGDWQEDQPEEQPGEQPGDQPEDLSEDQSDDQSEYESDGMTLDQIEEQPGDLPVYRGEGGAKSRQESDRPVNAIRQDTNSGEKAVDQAVKQQPEDLKESGYTAGTPSGDTAFYSNNDNGAGVVIDTEVHIDAAMPSDTDSEGS